MRRVTAYFGLSCLIAALFAPIFGVLLLVKGGHDPAINGESQKAGEAITMIRPTSLWAQPAEVNVETITCVASEFGGTKSTTLPVGDAPEGRSRVTNSRGEFRYLTSTSRAGFEVGSVTCTGSGLSSVTTATDSAAIGKSAAIMLFVATPLLAIVGFVIRRAGFVLRKA